MFSAVLPQSVLKSAASGRHMFRTFATRALLHLTAIVVLIATFTPAQAQRVTSSTDANLQAIRAILQTPEADIDLAKAKLAIDKMIDPSVDVDGTLSQLDAMAKSLKAMLPPNASKRLTLDALRYHVYTASPWNGNRPFQYDLDDPFGKNIKNKLLPTYLATRKGNCVSMPMMFIILGQKLGVDVTAATAPNHVFVKYRDDAGQLFNLETTSGAGFTRDVWMRQQYPSMTDESIASGIYMRALSKKETVVVMISTLLESYGERGQAQQRIDLARLVLEYDSKDVASILQQHSGYISLRNAIINRHTSPASMSEAEQSRLAHIEGNARALFERAYALGWRPLTQAAEDQYQRRATSAKQAQ